MFCLCKDPVEQQRRFPRTIAQKSILSICFSSTSQLVACTTPSSLLIWDLPQKALLQEFEHTDNDGDMQCLTFAHANNFVIAGGKRGISVFNLLPTTNQVRFHAKPAECLSLDVAKISQVGVYGLLNGAMQIFAQSEPGVVLFTLRAPGPVCSVCLNENGSVLVSCTNAKHFQVWDVNDRAMLHKVRHKTWVWASLCDSTGTRFISCEGQYKCTLHVWSNPTSSITLTHNNGRFESFAVSRDFTRVLFACDKDNSLILLNVKTQLWCEVAKFPVPIKDVSFAPTNSLCAVGLGNGQVWILDLSQKDKRALAALFHHTQDILPIEIFKLMKQMLCWNNKV